MRKNDPVHSLCSMRMIEALRAVLSAEIRLQLQREFLHGVEVREVLILVVQQQRRHIGAVILRRHLEKLCDLRQCKTVHDIHHTHIILTNPIPHSDAVEIGYDVVCLAGIAPHREFFDLKTIFRRNFMPPPIDAIYVRSAILQGDLNLVVIIIVLHKNAVLFLMEETIVGNHTAGIPVFPNFFQLAYRLPNLVEGLLQAVGDEVFLPCGYIGGSHFHGMSHNNCRIANRAGLFSAVNGLAVL